MTGRALERRWPTLPQPKYGADHRFVDERPTPSAKGRCDGCGAAVPAGIGHGSEPCADGALAWTSARREARVRRGAVLAEHRGQQPGRRSRDVHAAWDM